MKEGKIEIFLSYEEPVFKDNIMWLRPYLDREGFELLYYGANGWTVFIPYHPSNQVSPDVDNCTEDKAESSNIYTETKPFIISDNRGELHGATPVTLSPDNCITVENN